MVPLVAAAVVVAALVGGGLLALGRDGATGGSEAEGRATRADRTTPVAPVRLTMTPRDRAARVALDAKARVLASDGRLRAVRVTGAGGSGWPASWPPTGAAG